MYCRENFHSYIFTKNTCVLLLQKQVNFNPQNNRNSRTFCTEEMLILIYKVLNENFITQ